LELAFQPDRASAEPVYRQLEAYLRGLVEAGRLRPGEKLPATRELAAALGLARNTVAQAYDALCSDGMLAAHVGQGTFVAARAAGASRPPAPPGARGFAWEGLVARRVRRVPVAEALEANPVLRDPAYDFRAGGVDLDSAPETELRRAFSRALARHGRALAAHRDPLGWPPLREAIARGLVARGIACDPGEVAVVSGAQQALDLVARTLVDPGDAVAMEQPGYFAAHWAFAAAGAHLVGVPVDADGLDTDRLARVLRSRRVKLVYTTPAVQCPTGVVLSQARRAALLALADEHELPVVEDDYDSELRCGGPPIPGLKTRDLAGQVIYVGTFSKALVPALRIGYVVAPAPLLMRLATVRIACDFATNPIAQAALAELLEAGDLERHVRRVRKLYASRLRALDAALADSTPEGTRWTLPAGGNALWLRLPAAADPAGVWRAVLDAGIAASRGDFFHFDGGGRDALHLGVANMDESRIAEGARRLGAIVTRAARRGRRAA
jgi:GntR family transcriptional regulator/MocR family aminotransferase